MTELIRRTAAHRDALLAGAFLVFGVAELLAHAQYDGQPTWTGSRPVAFAAVALITLPLAFRRTRPLLSSLAVFPTIVVYSFAVGDMEATAVFLALLVAVFSGAAYARRPWVVAALAIAAMGVHNAFDSTIHGPGDWFWSFGFIVVSFLLGIAVRSKQIRIVSLEHDAETLAREQEARVAAATAAERAAIARELHDIVAHAVSVIVVQAQAGSRSLEDDPATTGRLLGVIETTGRSALADLRRLLRVLDDGGTSPDPSPGLAHLRDLVDRFRTTGLDVRLDLADPVPQLSTAADLAAYRLVQEALTNAVRHAPGARAAVSVRQTRDRAAVEVRDDGTGTPSASTTGAGRGLIGMRERVGLAGGRIVWLGPTGEGFVVRAELPVETDASVRVAG